MMSKIIGMTSSALGLVITLTNMEQVLRIVGVGLGCIITTLTIVDWLNKKRKEKR